MMAISGALPVMKMDEKLSARTRLELPRSHDERDPRCPPFESTIGAKDTSMQGMTGRPGMGYLLHPQCVGLLCWIHESQKAADVVVAQICHLLRCVARSRIVGEIWRVPNQSRRMDNDHVPIRGGELNNEALSRVLMS